MGAPGKRAAARPKRALTPRAIGFATGGVGALIAWAFLVWLAIHFGSDARSDDHGAWWLSAAATVGAIAALFICLLLLSRSVATGAGTSSPPESAHPVGKRAAR